MKTYFSILLLTVLLISSCKKQEVEDPITGNQPVFTAMGTIGTDEFSVSAGQNNFYMHTESSVVNGVDFFSGRLSDGNFELELGIYDGNLDLPANQFAQNLPSGLFFAVNQTMPLVTLSKDLFPNASLIQDISWFIDGVFAGTGNVPIKSPGKYNVTAEVTFNDNSTASLTNEMILGYTKHATCQLRHFLTPNGNLQVWMEENDVPITSVKWFIDNEYQNSDPKLNSTLDQQNHTIKAEITFQNGVVRTKSILVDGSLEGKFIDDFSVFENGSSSIIQDFNAVITLRKDGKEYASASTNNQSAVIEVISVDYFGTNTAGKAVVMIRAIISCNLKEISSGDVFPFQCETNFGVEID